MSSPDRPVFRELDRDQCDAILERNHVGRIAFSFHDRVDIQPIHYVRDDTWLYMRTDPGDKITTFAHNRWVAFEVDEIDGVFDWRSVVVRGGVYLLDRYGPASEREARERAVALLQSVFPRTLEPGDPAPFRDIVLRIYIDEMTGREARSERRG